MGLIRGKVEKAGDDQEQLVSVSKDGAIKVFNDGQPLAVETQNGKPLEVQEVAGLADMATGNTLAFATAAVTFTISEAGAYMLQAGGNTGYCRLSGTATSSVGGFDFRVFESETLFVRLPAGTLSAIASSVAGSLSVIRLGP